MAHSSDPGKVDPEKRRLLEAAGLSGLVVVGGLAPACLVRPAFGQEKDGKADQKKEGEVTPPEDLMREHGVLDRVLLIYEAGMRKFSSKEDFDPAVLAQSAEVVRDFIENYHEKTEEQHVFPRFKKAGKMVELVDTLLTQHQAGRRLTASILKFAPSSRRDLATRRQLVIAMRSFIAMYRPHAAREDTDLFPKLRSLVSANEYHAMAEEFEREEHQLFGDDGFEKMAERVARLERAVGIHDLNQFTPQ